ncbi:phenylpyruvate tautomerase MIF-related protein [Myxococcota bacterium]
MPVINVYSSANPPERSQADELLLSLSQTVSKVLGKPERYVMTCLMPTLGMTFGGTQEPACFVELKSIGQMSSTTTQQLSAAICQRLEAGLGVRSDRIYIEFTEAQGHLWGWNGSTFG